MGYSFIYVILNAQARREDVQQLVADRINAIRPQLPPDAIVTLGPNASSMGWIYQYALVDREKLRDLRELRLLNESQIKPALQTRAGHRRSRLGRRAREAVPGQDLSAAARGDRHFAAAGHRRAVQGVFQEAGGRMIEVTNRDYQLRGAINSDDIDKLDFLVVGRARDGTSVHLKDVGYLQVGYDQRRSTVDLDGAGEVVGGIVIMEQDQNVLAITRVARAEAGRDPARRCRRASKS